MEQFPRCHQGDINSSELNSVVIFANRLKNLDWFVVESLNQFSTSRHQRIAWHRTWRITRWISRCQVVPVEWVTGCKIFYGVKMSRRSIKSYNIEYGYRLEYCISVQIVIIKLIIIERNQSSINQFVWFLSTDWNHWFIDVTSHYFWGFSIVIILPSYWWEVPPRLL